jgi:DNA-binding transcriptional regulator YdaS (Cro superfamily)
VRQQPDHDENIYYEQLATVAKGFIASDAVLGAMLDDDSSDLARIDAVIRALAEEAAGLLYDRERLQREGRDGAAQVSSRRVEALARIARLVVLREELRRARGDANPEHIAKALRMLEVEVEAVAGEVLDPAVSERFLAVFRAKMATSGLTVER